MSHPTLEALLDQEVTIRGTARDAHLGAVVVTDDRTPVYIEGLEFWESPVSGRPVRVSGVLRRKKLAPDPVVGPDGGISHGITGTSFVLEDPHWHAE